MNDTADIATIATPVSSRDEVLLRLRRHEVEIRKFGATALYLFGSAARDEMTDESDVDVFIDYERDGNFTFVEFFDLKDFLSSKVHRKIDLATRDGLHPRLKSRIERSSVKVF